MNHRLRNSYIGMQGMPLLSHRRLSMVWVSHFCGSTRTLGKNARAGSRNYLTRGGAWGAGGPFLIFPPHNNSDSWPTQRGVHCVVISDFDAITLTHSSQHRA